MRSQLSVGRKSLDGVSRVISVCHRYMRDRLAAFIAGVEKAIHASQPCIARIFSIVLRAKAPKEIPPWALEVCLHVPVVETFIVPQLCD